MLLRPFRSLGRKLRFRSLQRRDFTRASGEHVENTDAMAAADFGDFDPGSGGEGGGLPPGYVKSYDEGRPRK
ncbi:MAG: hypothetical protein ACRDKU_09650 [Gaiellaceae bacterium]